MFIYKILSLFLLVGLIQAIDFKSLQFWANLFSGNSEIKKDFKDEIRNSNLNTLKNGTSSYYFIDYVSLLDNKLCSLKYEDELNLDNYGSPSKPIIKVNCAPNLGNGTVNIVESVKDVIGLLAPYGNGTNRNTEGSCSIILFYAKTCTASAIVAPHFNALAKQFPDIRIGAINAFQFRSFNAEFGIVGLPTVLLFHQGKPVIKFNDTTATVYNFAKFITRHTGIKSVLPSPFVTSEDFNGPLPNKVEKETDYLLYLAWCFILLCAGYYFTKSNLCYQLIEMIKRNWRESEVHLTNN